MFKAKRAQISSVDMLIALVLFLSILNVFLVQKNALVEQDYPFSEMAISVYKASGYLLSSQGYPADWNQTNVKNIGLTFSYGQIDSDRLALFLSLLNSSSQNATDLLGVSPYSLLLNVSYLNGTTVYLSRSSFSGNASFGSLSGDNVARTRRLAYIENDVVALDMAIGR